MDSQAFPARDGCIEVGYRCLAFSRLLTADQYARSNPPNDSVGAHLRHSLDFLVCFLRGLKEGVVRYDQRDRDVRISTDPEAFQEALQTILDELSELLPAQAGRSLELHLAADSAGSAAICKSSLERELVFLTGHSLHHLAIARLLAEAQGVHVPEELATAFSTALHRRRLAVSSSESTDV